MRVQSTAAIVILLALPVLARHDVRMAHVRFEVRRSFDVAARAVWDALVDWQHHGEWMPMTRIEVGPGAPTAIGTQITACTGLGPLSLVDRMEIVRCDWHDDDRSGECELSKLGPILRGRAGFTVEASGPGKADLVWCEDVRLPYTPQMLAPIVRLLGIGGFRLGMRRLEKLLDRSR